MEGKKDREIKDVIIPQHDIAMRWNLDKDGSLWLVSPDSDSEIGCIHPCQGLELDFEGVILSEDFVIRNGRVVTGASKHSSQDSSVLGYKKMLREKPLEAKSLADFVIKNTYRN